MPSVLTVDDEVDLLATYARLLKRLGYRVITATTRAEGLRALGSEFPKLVVADIRLPDGNGLDVVRAARATPSAPPVIVVTGFGLDSAQQAAMEAGASAFLSKPFSASAFLELVARLLPPGAAVMGTP